MEITVINITRVPDVYILLDLFSSWDVVQVISIVVRKSLVLDLL